MPIPEDRFLSVIFEALRRDFGNQWLGLTQSVAWVAVDRGIYPAPHDTRVQFEFSATRCHAPMS